VISRQTALTFRGLADHRPPYPDLAGGKVGEYDIVSRLGVGGMGVVYEGLQPLIGKRVAVKVLLPQVSKDRELVERFISEARAVNAIGHRGIVDIFSFGQLPSGEHYFVMEYLDGLPFDRLIKHRAPVAPQEALAWVEEICEALTAAHDAGVIHRDIKPSNLFLVDTGRGRPYVKLLDFGIAKLEALTGEVTPQTRASMVIGTPDYMSPEQARGKNISPATDVYSLGCVLFELLTGERLFSGDNALHTMFMHVETPPPKVSDFLVGQSPELDDLVLWTVAKDPLARPVSAEELRTHLANFRATLPALPPVARPSIPRGSTPGRSPRVPTPLPLAVSPVSETAELAPPRPTDPHLGDPNEPPVVLGIPEGKVPIDLANIWDEPPVRELVKQRQNLNWDELVSNDEMPTDGGMIPLVQSTTGLVPAPLPVSTTPARPTPLEGPGKPKVPFWAVATVLIVLGITIGAVIRRSRSEPSSRDVKRIVVKPIELKATSKAEEGKLLVSYGKPNEVKPLEVRATRSGTVEAKPAEVEPAEVKPAEVKPAEVKAAELKAAEVKAAELKAAEVKAAEVKAAEVKAAEVKAAEVKAAEVKAAEVKAAEVKAAEVKAAEVKAAEVKAAEVKASVLKPTKPPVRKPVVAVVPIAADAITKRIEKLQRKLDLKEAASGDSDRVLRQFIGQARSDAEKATTDAKRRELWKFLDEVQRQLDGR
jgi:serine/threonine protein kinase